MHLAALSKHMYDRSQSRSIRARRDMAINNSSSWEGARSDERKAHLFLTSKLSPDADLEFGDTHSELADRANSLMKSDPYASGSARTFANHIVGSGFRFQSQIRPIDGLITKEFARLINQEIEEIWQELEETIDPLSRQHFADIDWTAAWNWKVKGEAFIVESAFGSFDDLRDRPVPLMLQCIAPERVETPDELVGDPRFSFGIERDRPGGRITHYHIRKTHPGDPDADFEYERVPAERVHHLYDVLWPGQSRGVSAYAPMLDGSKDLHSWIGAELEAKHIEALFAAFEESADPMAAKKAGTSATSSDGKHAYEDIVPGTMTRVSHGYKMSFANPQRPGNNFQPFYTSMNRRNAAGINMPYEWYANDWTGVTFSSGRLSEISGSVAMKRDQSKYKRTVKFPVFRRFMLELVFSRRTKLTHTMYNRRKRAFLKGAFIPLTRPDIDLTKWVKAQAEAHEKLHKPLSRIAAEEGEDAEQDLIDFYREQDLIRELAPDEEETNDDGQQNTTRKSDQDNLTNLECQVLEDESRLMEFEDRLTNLEALALAS